MKSTSRFLHTSKSSGTQLMGLAGSMPSTKRLQSHVRANIIGPKSSSSVSYIRVIAKDIRKRSEQAVGGSNFAKEISNYYATLGLDPYRIAGDLQSRFPNLLPPSIKTEDVKNDSGLSRELEKLEGYLAGTYGGGPGYHQSGSYSFGSSGGSGSSGGGSGAGNGSSGGGSSMPDIASVAGGGNTMWWILGGAGVLGLVLMMRK